MHLITVSLKSKFITPERIKDKDHSPNMFVRNEETTDNLYFCTKDEFIRIGVDCFASEKLRTKFARFCDNLYFLTDHYKLTGGQIPASVLFCREEKDIGLYLYLKSKFFEVEVI